MKAPWLSISWFAAIVIGFGYLLPSEGWVFVVSVVGFLTFIFITFHAGLNLKDWWNKS